MKKTNGTKVRHGQTGPEFRAKYSHYGQCLVSEGQKNFVKVHPASDALLFFLSECLHREKPSRLGFFHHLEEGGERGKRDTQYLSRLWDCKRMV